jgi:hypothetical protein
MTCFPSKAQLPLSVESLTLSELDALNGKRLSQIWQH